MSFFSNIDINSASFSVYLMNQLLAANTQQQLVSPPLQQWTPTVNPANINFQYSTFPHFNVIQNVVARNVNMQLFLPAFPDIVLSPQQITLATAAVGRNVRYSTAAPVQPTAKSKREEAMERKRLIRFRLLNNNRSRSHHVVLNPERISRSKIPVSNLVTRGDVSVDLVTSNKLDTIQKT